MASDNTYGLIGKKLSHSFSQTYFREKFSRLGIDADYVNFEISTIEEIEGVFKTNPKGLNVTIPYKEAVLDYMDDLSPAAKEIGAVNTVVFKNGKRTGHNTDAFGFQQMIKPYFESQHEKALVFGTGGAAKAVEYVLDNLGVQVISISRNPEPGEYNYEDVNDFMVASCKMLVNCTPVGMFPNVDECLTIPFEFLTSQHLVIDLIYNPQETLFLQKAKQAGAVTLNGLTMLQQQAEQAWKLWNE